MGIKKFEEYQEVNEGYGGAPDQTFEIIGDKDLFLFFETVVEIQGSPLHMHKKNLDKNNQILKDYQRDAENYLGDQIQREGVAQTKVYERRNKPGITLRREVRYKIENETTAQSIPFDLAEMGFETDT